MISGDDLLARALAACGREGWTGVLRVSGAPGGTLHVRDGLVVAAESPGAPGPEALLLRSGRVNGEQWAQLVREAGGARWPAAGLIARGYAGAAQLRVVCVMALQDAAFAIGAGRVDGCERAGDGAEPTAPVAVGEPPARLLQDAARKLAALAALPHSARPDRERPLPAPQFDGPLTELRRELLDHADGRRTAQATSRGTLRQTVTYGSHGCAAFYAVGDTALMVVLGDEGMDVDRLHRATQPALDRIGSILQHRNKTAEGV